MSLFSGKEEADRRMRICMSCEKFKHSLKICGICKCYMPFKTKILKSTCPINRWKQLEPRT